MNEILEYLKTVISATINDIYLNTNTNYYNPHKEISQILNRLVKQGKVIKIKKGVFKIAPEKNEIINQEERW